MDETFTIKRGDSFPSLGATLPDDVNLAGATVALVLSKGTLKDIMTPRGCVSRVVPDGVVFTKAAQVVSAEDRTIQYNWANGDTLSAGRYLAEFKLTYAGGRVRTYPALGYLNVTIVPDLGATAVVNPNPNDDEPGEPGVTFYLLTESGDRIVTEAGDRITLESQ